MEKPIYKHVRSEFSEPQFTGEFKGQGAPFLTFIRAVNQEGIPAIVQLTLNYEVQGVGNSFHFNCSSIALFEVYQSENLRLNEVYEMHTIIVNGLEAYLKEKIGRNGALPVVVPKPTIEQLQDELHAFIFRYHFGPQATNQLN
ncbi:hypothetical protein [Puia dinghuensis]|uniref:Uncharacterized protein n=1 Tax=Puia dinghuensis TaxID=1792502 RepID=A0A8J2UHF3_9BACT|nr:hypothetical protein [Puia dinghuensis]GGB15981.1 hypothetical protein GCM10011511_44790 [Puia dinghuensis]